MIEKVLNQCAALNSERVRVAHGMSSLGPAGLVAAHVARQTLRRDYHFDDPAELDRRFRPIEGNLRGRRASIRRSPGSDRFAFSAGGESLNPFIQQTAPDNVSPELLAQFTSAAQAIVAAGAAAFGELAAEHFSAARKYPNHPYESAPADHPLLLALADIAASYGMPVELHMEAVPRDVPFRSTAGRYSALCSSLL